MNGIVKTGLAALLFCAALPLYPSEREIPQSAITIGSLNSDYSTIHEALDDPLLPDGSILYLTDGIYTEQNILIEKNVTITGRNRENTIVQAADVPGAATGRIFEIGKNANVTLKNMTIRNGNATECPRAGGAIYNWGNLVLENCLITENRGSCAGGIAQKKGSLIIRNSIISGNTAHGEGAEDQRHGSGGGIKCFDGNIEIYDTVISDNSANLRGGGIKISCLSTVLLSGCTIENNSARGDGGGVHIKGTAKITASKIRGNISSIGGGILNEGVLSIVKTTVADNQVRNLYGCAGLLTTVEGTLAEISRCTIDEIRDAGEI